MVGAARGQPAGTISRADRPGMSLDQALEVIATMSGDHLAAEVVAVLPAALADLGLPES